ncbi:ABC transporter ATP-binding protein [Solimonas marina]|uniref:ATP-binding cassette domain-containing protein n=1 Tax=Solimonas marina TaxID=2714601 RepID=A0A969WFE5_9GAMM|nr:oligopeptide/dipeptide ABC transporter ATP-binding protein [Solimonas marina]NKF24316.1 ATP-binding cassette domain-containing protein [Solimonas marina]
MTSEALIEVRSLDIEFTTPDGLVRAGTGLDLDIHAGEFVGIVGESGSGKSQLLLALLGLNAKNGRLRGSIRYRGTELVGAGKNELGRIRGDRISMIFQDPMTALNPHLRIGRQLTEGLQRHRKTTAAAARARAVEMLRAVHLTEPERRLDQYPHELSGGMRQRVMIAMALICEPELILADEPTTALDVTVQAQILELLQELRQRFGTAVVMVTHDLGVVAQIADRVAVMYGGRIVERGDVDDIFYRSRHPYTEGLRRAIPRLGEDRAARLATIPGNPPNLAQLPRGCPFAPRCAYHMPRCDAEMPTLETVAGTHRKACFYDGPLADAPEVLA